MNRNLVKKVISEGGNITPLLIPSSETNGTGLMNPSIYDDNGNLILNLRHVNYTLYHCEGQQLFNNRWGPLAYLNPENDIHLRTNNFLCNLNSDLSIKDFCRVDTSKLDVEPIWEFVGLEDARVVRWDNKLYLIGVRRDTTTNGVGRMELSEISIENNIVKEISRIRIEPPNNPNSYCEKNWMPILDMPFHFVKWTNPTEVVKVDLTNKTSQTIHLSLDVISNIPDLRGSSQVINYKDYRMCVVHDVALWKNKLQQKDAKYLHRFVIWDKDWNIVKISEPFSFMDGEIEFCCGMTLYKNDLLITFGFQDNAAFTLKVPSNIIDNVIELNDIKEIFIDDISEKSIDINEKLKDFPLVYYISHIDLKNRYNYLENEFNKYGIKYKSNISTNESDTKKDIKGPYLQALNDRAKFCITSHLISIKDWYDNSDTPYAIFMEDDISFETIEYWNFTWNKFMSNLPLDWDCIQLSCIRYNMYNVKLKRRLWDDWSAIAFMIKRDYAKRLLAEYYDGEVFNLDIKNTNLQPIPENILYYIGKTYTIPLFVENIEFKTTFIDRIGPEEHDKLHINSVNFVLNWWKEKGRKTNIKKLMKII